MVRNTTVVRDAISARMTYSDRVCFASAATLAADTGLHPCTVRRTIARLEHDRVIERVHGFAIKGRNVRSCAWRFCLGVRRIAKCSTTKQSYRKPLVNHQPLRGWRVRATRKTYIWRVLVGEVVPITDTPVRNTTAGQALFAQIVDDLAAAGIRLPSRVIATAAKQGREALDAGVDAKLVLEGCLAAIRQGKQRYTAEIIADVVMAVGGQRLTGREYRQTLDGYQNDHDPSVIAQRNLLEQARELRRQT